MEHFEFRNIVGDKFININFNTTFDKVGIENDIDKYVKFKQKSLVNPIIDTEYNRFKYNNQDDNLLIPNFKNLFGDYSTDLVSALFTLEEINNQDPLFTNSFFIFEYFDLTNENQTLLSTSYLKPLINKGNTYLSTIDSNNKIISFKTQLKYTQKLTTWNEFNYIKIPNNYLYLDKIYLKISFFNSKIGGRTYFHTNSTDTNNPTNLDFYLTINLDKNLFKYNFISFNNTTTTINLYEFKNIKFINKENKNNLAKGSNKDTKTLILGTGDII